MPTVQTKSAGVTSYPQPSTYPGNVLRAAPPPPPGWFGGPSAQTQAQQLPTMVSTIPTARRFPGHFVPHRLCNHFSTHGWCRKAEACTFAHGMQELHPDVQTQLVTAYQPGLAMGPPVTGITKAATYNPGVPNGNTNVFAFNVGAVPFVPRPAENGGTGCVNVDVTDGDRASGSGTGSNDADAKEPASDSAPSSPNRRRPVPSPLTDDADSPVRTSMIGGTIATLAPASPLASPMAIKTVARHSVASPVPACQLPISLRQQVMSPAAAMMSPTSSMCATASAVAMMALASPTSPTAAHVQMQSPTANGPMSSVLLRSPISRTTVPWPGSPVIPASPTAASSTPVPIARSTLLQARTIVQKLEQGPPGLAHCAPTPTTKAKYLGFRYPEPGWLTARPMPAVRMQ